MDDDDFGHVGGCFKSDGDWFCSAQCSRERRIRKEAYQRGIADGLKKAASCAVCEKPIGPAVWCSIACMEKRIGPTVVEAKT